MRRAAIVLAMGIGLLASGEALAVETRDFDAKNAGELANLCAAKPVDAKGTAAQNFCHGFAQGAVDVRRAQERASGGKPSFCFPNPAPKRTATLDEFVTWVRAQPSRLSSRPDEALFQFMSERFPCSK